jgi:hypothetical protein
MSAEDQSQFSDSLFAWTTEGDVIYDVDKVLAMYQNHVFVVIACSEDTTEDESHTSGFLSLRQLCSAGDITHCIVYVLYESTRYFSSTHGAGRSSSRVLHAAIGRRAPCNISPRVWVRINPNPCLRQCAQVVHVLCVQALHVQCH